MYASKSSRLQFKRLDEYDKGQHHVYIFERKGNWGDLPNSEELQIICQVRSLIIYKPGYYCIKLFLKRPYQKAEECKCVMNNKNYKCGSKIPLIDANACIHGVCNDKGEMR